MFHKLILFCIHFTQNFMLIPNLPFYQVYFNILGDICRESPKSQKCRFLAKIRDGYGLFWSKSMGFGQGYSEPVQGYYIRVRPTFDFLKSIFFFCMCQLLFYCEKVDYFSKNHIVLKIENRLLAKIITLENLVKNNEYMFKLGPRYFTLTEIFRTF